MLTALWDVAEFHHKFGQKVGDPRNPDVTQDQELRLKLIQEEFEELTEALWLKAETPEGKQAQLVEVADALGDMIYVIIGSALAWGIDIASVFDAIHESNMTKTPGNLREDGKILKGDDFQEPQIAEALAEAAQHGPESDNCWWPYEGLERDKPETISVEADDPDRFLAELDELSGSFAEYAEVRIQGNTHQLTSYGALVFDCECGRTHALDCRNGTRGGWKVAIEGECMCGRVNSFAIDAESGKATKLE